MIDHDYWRMRREQHEVIATLREEDQHMYDVVLGVVGNPHNQVLELGPIDPPRRGGLRRGKRPNIARGIIEGYEHLMRIILLRIQFTMQGCFVKGLECLSVCFFKY